MGIIKQKTIVDTKNTLKKKRNLITENYHITKEDRKTGRKEKGIYKTY